MSGASACIATIEERPDAPLNLTKCGASACIATIEDPGRIPMRRQNDTRPPAGSVGGRVATPLPVLGTGTAGRSGIRSQWSELVRFEPDHRLVIFCPLSDY